VIKVYDRENKQIQSEVIYSNKEKDREDERNYDENDSVTGGTQ